MPPPHFTGLEHISDRHPLPSEARLTDVKLHAGSSTVHAGKRRLEQAVRSFFNYRGLSPEDITDLIAHFSSREFMAALAWRYDYIGYALLHKWPYKAGRHIEEKTRDKLAWHMLDLLSKLSDTSHWLDNVLEEVGAKQYLIWKTDKHIRRILQVDHEQRELLLKDVNPYKEEWTLFLPLVGYWCCSLVLPKKGRHLAYALLKLDSQRAAVYTALACANAPGPASFAVDDTCDVEKYVVRGVQRIIEGSLVLKQPVARLRAARTSATSLADQGVTADVISADAESPKQMSEANSQNPKQSDEMTEPQNVASAESCPLKEAAPGGDIGKLADKRVESVVGVAGGWHSDATADVTSREGLVTEESPTKEQDVGCMEPPVAKRDEVPPSVVDDHNPLSRSIESRLGTKRTGEANDDGPVKRQRCE